MAEAAVEVEPVVSVGVSRSDNITLAADNETSETVYQLLPSISILQSAGRTSSSLSYALQGYYYSDRSDTEAYHSLDARVRTALDPDNIFLDVGASREQVVRDPTEPVPFGNLALSGNRTDRDDFHVTPSFQYLLGGNARISGSYSRSWVRHDDVAPNLGPLSVRDFAQDSAQIALDNYGRQSGITWAVRYGIDKTDFDVVRPWEFRQASVELGTWAGRGVRIFATAGKESAWDDPLDPSLEDGYWEAGMSKNAGERFSATLAAGERTFGTSRRASVDLQLRRGRMGLSYAESPTTEGRRTSGAGVLVDSPDDFLSRPGAIERYISNRFQLSYSVQSRRGVLSFGLFDESREQRATLFGTPLPDEEQTGGNASLSWNAGARTSFTLAGQRGRREFSGSDERVLTSVSLGLQYGLGVLTDLSFQFQTSKDKPREQSSLVEGYRANLLTVLLTRRFKASQ